METTEKIVEAYVRYITRTAADPLPFPYQVEADQLRRAKVRQHFRTKSDRCLVDG